MDESKLLIELERLRLKHEEEMRELVRAFNELGRIFQDVGRGKYLIRFTAEVLEDGRITIPSAIRKKYNIKKGDLLELELTQIIDGEK